jgi:hypothetical protein
MGVSQQSPFDRAGCDTAGATLEDDSGYSDAIYRQQVLDSEFLDAVCNGLLCVNENFRITSQNYISRVNMGDLVGQCCYHALENRAAPCDNCPRIVPPTGGEYETSIRCAGKGRSLYEARIYTSENSSEVVEVYPDMIDREIVIKNLYLYREELDLLNSVVEHIRNAIADDCSHVRA